jgi:hypothetical protein
LNLEGNISLATTLQSPFPILHYGFTKNLLRRQGIFLIVIIIPNSTFGKNICCWCGLSLFSTTKFVRLFKKVGTWLVHLFKNPPSMPQFWLKPLAQQLHLGGGVYEEAT